MLATDKKSELSITAPIKSGDGFITVLYRKCRRLLRRIFNIGPLAMFDIWKVELIKLMKTGGKRGKRTYGQ